MTLRVKFAFLRMSKLIFYKKEIIMQPQISVVIPVYNASEHLVECLESLLKQSYTDFEVICVNDGSTDKSLEVLKLYQNKDSRIKILSQENQGTAKARENGIKNASGSWIAYLDADDYVSSEYLQKLYSHAQKENSDAVFCYYYDVIGDKLKKHKKKIKNIKISGMGKFSYATGACKIIKKDLFAKVCFAEKCNFGEDSSISMQIALQKPKLSILPEYLYFYRRHSASVVLQKSALYKQIPSLLQGYAAIETFCIEQNIFTIQLKKFLYKKMNAQMAEIILGACK